MKKGIQNEKPLTSQAINLKLNLLSETAGFRYVHPHLYHGLAMLIQGQGHNRK